ncbi:hypothetical protein CWB89_06020 [Pseudoalteromonas piscicida]|uniref:Uncharacterized protein n=1 Tax=Pseudoalteromonas piscicida TaxID=43662 RepID=A0AAD0RGC2_PSEO7|nr:hypothetical protein B1L02_14790 [Pseudoalteromonas piscicida]NSY35249.1 hypothetical protein [Pseudoalteromonas sp. JC28]TMN35976.1 hypothetical protein CWC03_14455 [Pseudoalteromonas sp. S2755]TMN84310.1 hypothetical protein CWB87_05800 [Pseudoalteromonas flavipulchra]AXQ99099.1 hypothetical protein D0N37_16125 [Pseudoalteromonas piscicida]|tara:strand:- start:84 stop:290 length:207 start_codon:yes stop_codon:yes gene_type:complete
MAATIAIGIALLRFVVFDTVASINITHRLLFVWLFALLFFALLTAFFTKMTALTFNFTLKSISLPVRI